MKHYHLFVICFLVSSLMSAQCLEDAYFTRAISPSDNQGRDIYIDDNDHIYIAGQFEGTVDFDFGEDSLLVSSLDGNQDGFIAKFDPSGSVQWVLPISGFGTIDWMLSIDAANPNEIYVSGRVDDGINIAGQSFNCKNANSIIIKLDGDGEILWVKFLSATSSGQEILVDQNRDVIVTGFFRDNLWVEGTTLTSAGASDTYLIKYAPDGSLIWAKSYGTAESESVNSMVEDNDGNYIFSGWRSSVQEMFTTKVNSSGIEIWTNVYEGSSSGSNTNNWIWAQAIDHNDNLYLTGHIEETVDFTPSIGGGELVSNGRSDIFVAKFQANGDYLWSVNFGGDSFDRGYGLNLSPDSVIHVVGYFLGSVDFDPGVEELILESDGWDDFLLSLSLEGDFISVEHFEAPNSNFGRDINYNGQGSVFITGEGDNEMFIKKLAFSGVENSWKSGMVGCWFDSLTSWSRGVFPAFCNDVIIPSSAQLSLKSDNKGLAGEIQISNGAIFTVESGAELEIGRQN